MGREQNFFRPTSPMLDQELDCNFHTNSFSNNQTLQEFVSINVTTTNKACGATPGELTETVDKLERNLLGNNHIEVFSNTSTEKQIVPNRSGNAISILTRLMSANGSVIGSYQNEQVQNLDHMKPSPPPTRKTKLKVPYPPQKPQSRISEIYKQNNLLKPKVGY